MEDKHSAKFLRQRKMMMVLPLLTLPFVTMAFWALGGGKGIESKDHLSNAGLNLQLPDANLKDDKSADKLSFYKHADADLLKREELLRNDPYYKDSMSDKQDLLFSAPEALYNPLSPGNNLNYSTYNKSSDANEHRIYQKINEITKEINQPDIASSNYTNPNKPIQAGEKNEQFSSDIDRLQDMMQLMNDKPEVDPEMQQLNGTLDKILDIQNPDRVQQRLKEKSLQQKETVYAASINPVEDNVSLLDTNKDTLTGTGFYGINEGSQGEDHNSIEAVVHESQILFNGAVVKLRLLNDIYINGSLIPKDIFIFGIASLNGERLEIEIKSIRNNKSLFPVKLEVYDMDGIAGIYIPGAISRDVVKQSADNSLQSMELTSMNPSLKTQLATNGINAAKSFLSKKAKQVKVMVKAGYIVLLKNKNNQ